MTRDGFTAWEQEHLRDPADLCDATVLLDDVEVLVVPADPYEASEDFMDDWRKAHKAGTWRRRVMDH